MAIDMLKKTIHNCESLPIEELDRLLRAHYNRYDDDNDKVRIMRYIREVTFESIPWEELRYVRLMCKSEDQFIPYAMEEIPCGFYLNADKTWFLAVFEQNDRIEDTLDRCGASIVSLWLYGSSISSLDVRRLSGLKELSLRNHPVLECINQLGQLTNLDQLTISTCPNLIGFHGLGNLTKLTKLTISYAVSFRYDSTLQKRIPVLNECSKLTSLPGLERLTNLTQLNLFGCCSLTSLPEFENFTRLSMLNLTYCFNLTTLPRLDKIPTLTNLHLSNCSSLTTLPGLEKLTALTSLFLCGCEKLTVLPAEIRDLKSLRKLDLRDMHLQEVPEWLPEISESFIMTDGYDFEAGATGAVVNLKGTTIEGVDMAVFDQPYNMVVEWFENHNKIPLNEIKVVFLGDGEAGKSLTISRLLNDGGNPDEETFDGQSTPGIVISNKEYDLDGRKIQVHYWDFGGQEIMHSMHRIFLTGRTMYVILLNARDDTQSDRAKYWLHNVKSFAPNAPVLLVLNKVDQNDNASVDEIDLRGRYDKLTKIVRLSALKYSQEEFNNKFTKVLLDEIRNTGFLNFQWPASWIKVKESLENLDIKEKPYIMGDAYQNICMGCQVNKSQKDLLHWFNDLGVSFCFCDEGDYALQDYVILRPDWITNALYIILFNKLEGAQNGLIPHASIHEILRNAHSDPAIRCTLPQAKYSTGDIQYVLGVMRKFNLSFQYGGDHEFIPMLCQQNSTVDIQYYHKDEDTLEFNMVFDYLPNNLLHRLMVERHQELDMDNVWRTGARFLLPGTELSAVVTVDDRVLHIFIRNSGNMHRPNTYLAMLKANVDRIVHKMGIKVPKCKLVYKIHGNRAIFSYNRLLNLHARGEKKEYCEDLDEYFPIEDILNQSAPAASGDLNLLLESMISACLHLQGNKNYRGWDENGRNSVVRDSLGDKGYIVLDQNLRGTSETGKSYGELDLLIQRVPNRPWVLCEALIAEGYTHKWNEHLDKLLNEYNPHGLPSLFLLTYVDCNKSKFDSIWTKYKQHICDDNPKNFVRMPETVLLDLCSEYEYIKIARCSYQHDSYAPVVYHIFVQMDPQ